MRVKRKGGGVADLGDEITGDLIFWDQVLTLKCTVARVDKSGFRRYVYGLEFMDIDRKTRAHLTSLSRAMAEKRSM